MVHLIFKSDRAPPLRRQVVTMVMVMGGAVCGETLQQHHISACVGDDTDNRDGCVSSSGRL